MKTPMGRAATGILPALVVLLFIAAYVVTGFATLDATSRLVPLLAAGVTLVLLVLDVYRSLASGKRATVGDAGRGDDDDDVTPEREIAALAYVAAGVLAICLVGFKVGLPLYLFASIAWLGRQSLRIATVVAIVASLGIYVVFEVILTYELYPGVLFS